MKAVYLPIIRELAFQFVRIWNVHRIRKDKRRPHSVSGKPHILFWYPDVEDQGIPIDKDFVDRMIEATDDWGLYSRSL